jgi:hypothetical protein
MAEHENSAETLSPSGGASETALPQKIRFDYIKSAAFRVIHADGVVGGLSPRLDIQMNFWSERFPIPKQVVHAVQQDGTLGEEIQAERSTREAIVREVDAGVVLDLEVAKALQEWLKTRITEAERILAERQENEGGKK